MSDDHVTLMYDELEGESVKAYRFRMGDNVHWMPKSICRIVCEPTGTLPGEVDVPSWFASQEGLEGYLL